MHRHLASALLLTALAACAGPGAAPPTALEHVVVSFLPEGTGDDRVIREYAQSRRAELLRARSLDADRAFLLDALRKRRPEFATFFVPAAAFDSDFALGVQDLAAAIDPDPFTDVSYGFVPVVDSRLLARWWQAVKVADYRGDKRLFRVSSMEMAPVSEESVERLEWASGLPRKSIRLQPGDSKWIADHVKDLEESDLVLVSGPGSHDGVLGGLDPATISRLRLDSQVVFLGVPRSATVAVSTPAADPARRETVDPARSLAVSYLRQGAVALLAPLDDDSGAAARAEFDFAILSSAPLGHVVKRTLDSARLLRTLRAEPLPMKTPGRPVPGEYARQPRVLAALSRVLIGDPSSTPFHRPTQQPVRTETGPVSGRRFEARFRVVHPEARHLFSDPCGDGDLLLLRVPLPPGSDRATADLRAVEIDGTRASASIAGQAFEDWDGKPWLVVALGAANGVLARRDLQVILDVRLE